LDIRHKNLRKANLGQEGDEEDFTGFDENMDFEKNIDVKMLLKAKAVRDGDLELFDRA
jgi:hypothetical protein